MASKIIPNSFQTPNAHVDMAMHYLSGDEYKVLNFAVRHIYGWQDRAEKFVGRISLSTFVDGFTTASGTHYHGCGLGKAAVIKALEALKQHGLLDALGEPTQSGQMWRIGESPDWDGLAKRQSDKATVNKHRADKMNAARQKKQGGSSHDTGGSSHDTGGSSHDTGGSSHDTAGGSSHDTTGGSSHDTHTKPSKSHPENHDSAANAAQALEPSAIVSSKKERSPKQIANDEQKQFLIDALGDAFGVMATEPDKRDYIAIAYKLVKGGVQPDQFKHYMDFWKNRAKRENWTPTLWSTIAKGRISEYVAKRDEHQRKQADLPPAIPGLDLSNLKLPGANK